MTVFAEFKVFDQHTEKGTWAAFTDGAITTNEIEHFPAVSVPTLFGLDDQEFRSRVRQVMSKCVVRSDRCVFWAGDVLVAKHICAILIQRNPRSYEEFIEAMLSFGEQMALRVQIMLVCYVAGKIETFGWQTRAFCISHSVEMMGGGSGWDDLLEIDLNSQFGIDLQYMNKNYVSTAIEWAIIATASMLDIERSSPDQSFLDYGGCADLISFDSQGFARRNFFVLEATTSKHDPSGLFAFKRLFASYGLEDQTVLLLGDLDRLDQQHPFHISFSRDILTEPRNQLDVGVFDGQLTNAIIRVVYEDGRYTYMGKSPFELRATIEKNLVTLRIQNGDDALARDKFIAGLNGISE